MISPEYTKRYEYESSVNYKKLEAQRRLDEVVFRMGQLTMQKLYWEEQIALSEIILAEGHL